MSINRYLKALEPELAQRALATSAGSLTRLGSIKERDTSLDKAASKNGLVPLQRRRDSDISMASDDLEQGDTAAIASLTEALPLGSPKTRLYKVWGDLQKDDNRSQTAPMPLQETSLARPMTAPELTHPVQRAQDIPAWLRCLQRQQHKHQCPHGDRDEGDANADDGENEDSPILTDATTAFARMCVDLNLTPEPIIVHSDTTMKHLNLAHKGLGDKYGLVVAQCLLNFPDLEVLNVRDNRFTDESMDQLLSNAIRIRSLRVLNLSENKIDMDSADG
jgi:hypothetical protein